MIKVLNEQFVPITDNCSYTQTQQDAKGEFFRLVAEQGHYAGRTKPTATRQGLYSCAADGELLASINTTNPDHVLEMLNRALEKWNQSKNEPNKVEVPQSYEPDRRYHREFPEGGSILKVYVRDLPREPESNWSDSRWNADHAWLTQAEVQAMVPDGVQVGDSYPMPEVVARRLARFHLVDTVRGESHRWRLEDIKKSEITLTVEKASRGNSPRLASKIKLRLEGSVLNTSPPSFQTNPFSGATIDKERGVDLQLLGYLTYDKELGQLDRFDLIAVGQRWGATVYNVRNDDLGPAPIGFAFELVADVPANRTPPQSILSDYFG